MARVPSDVLRHWAGKGVHMKGLVLCLSGILSLSIASLASAQPVLLGEDLTSNRFDNLPADRAQVVAFYDGAETGETALGIEFQQAPGPGFVPEAISAADTRQPRRVWIWIRGLRKFDNVIETREYELNGWGPTGRFKVRKVTPDGVVDGVAFGLFWKDVEGRYRLLQSNDDTPTFDARFVCGWPLGMNDATFAARTPQVTDAFAREQAKMGICGAKLLGGGLYSIGAGRRVR